MQQVNFSSQAIGELKKFDKFEQMELIEQFSKLSTLSEVGEFDRDGKHFNRFKFNQVRIYFAVEEDSYFVHYILPQHTFLDFVFRFKLPINQEWMIEQDPSFWNYLESLK